MAKKEFLLNAGKISNKICFVKLGLLRCFCTKENNEISSWFMREGDVVISVKSFFTQQPGNEFIQALEPTLIYFIYYDELQNIYRAFPEFNVIGRVLTEKYYTLSEDRLASIRLQRADERYHDLLDQHPTLIQRVPSKYLASYLGITEVHLSRIKANH